MYCMRNNGEAEAEAGMRSTVAHTVGTNTKNKSIMNTLRSLWSRTEGEQSASGRERERGVRDQHRFIDVTDPSLHHIVSQQHAKAITGEDYLIAETLKREAHRVARAHTRSAGSRRAERESSQVFYEEGDTTTHRSPINPIFYESRARSAKLGTAAVGEGKSSSRSKSVRSSSEGYTIKDNSNSNSNGNSVGMGINSGGQGEGPMTAVQDTVINNSNSPSSQNSENSNRRHHGNTAT